MVMSTIDETPLPREEYPTVLHVLSNLDSYGINPNRFDKLYNAHRKHLGKRVCYFDGHDIPPMPTVESVICDAIEILKPQSGETSSNYDLLEGDGLNTYENVRFSDQMDPYILDASEAPDETRKLQDSSDATLERFFSRPIKIHEDEWLVDGALNFDIDPWSLYLQNPRVANRLTNYKLLRCNLHIKVIINGNSFHYGRMLVGYNPLDLYDATATFVAGTADNVRLSQCPHIFLDPNTSMGGQMKLPFFWHQNYFDITSSSWTGGAAGRLYFRTLNNLIHANNATDAVTVTVFAWAEDVSMNMLTSNDQNTLTPQSGEIDEANMKGTISGPATTVAKWAAYFNGIPYIAPFAKATEIGGNAVAGMAKLFGYCKPVITKAPEPFRPQPVSTLAVTNVPDVCQKLTVDDKQELSIDPRIAGVSGADPFNIRNIACRESYLTTFDWLQSTTPDTLLWNARVSPVIWAEEAGPPVSYHFPACAMAALPFQYWKGTMKFRFQIVASSFHKGRIRVVYDPNFMANSNYLGYSEYNTNYQKVVDIGEEQDFTMEVGMGQDQSFLTHLLPGADSVTEAYSTSRYSSNLTQSNGVIAVYIVNELTGANSSVNKNVQINVFVSMGDDFEVAVPYDDFANFVLAPQSGELVLEEQSGEMIVPEAQDTMEPSKPEQTMSDVLGMPPVDSSNLNDVFFGEAITSFRPMMKRYSLWLTQPKGEEEPTVISGRFSAMPYLRGGVPGAVDTTASISQYNYCNTLLMHWVSYAFNGRRGSVRWKFIPRGQQGRGDSIMVQRAPFVPGAAGYVFTNRQTMANYTTDKSARLLAIQGYEATGINVPTLGAVFPGSLGEALTINHVNGVLEFEMPYYSNNRFTPGRDTGLTQTMTFDAAFDYRMFFTGNGVNSDTSCYDIHCAIGEDFQCYFFTGLPRMYWEPTPPP
jgi:hypothetical protein